MSKKKKVQPTPPPPPKADAVPCLRVVIGGRPGSQGKADAKACQIVGENRGAVTKFELGRKYKSTSKSVSTPKKNKPCLGSLKRKGCPVQLAFDQGQPFLRFCTTEKQAGYRVDVDTPEQAVKQANAACETWKSTGKFNFPDTTPLRGSRK